MMELKASSWKGRSEKVFLEQEVLVKALLEEQELEMAFLEQVVPSKAWMG